MDKKKPPLGITPRSIHDRHRACHILNAMMRYSRAGKTIPLAWRQELRDLYTTLTSGD